MGHAGPDWFVTDVLASATEFVIDILENRLGLQVSPTKSNVIASSTKQAQKIASLIRSGKVKTETVAKMLGTATTSGRTRSVKVLKKRIKDTREKGGRIKGLRRCGVNTAIWARTAGVPGLTYGADLTGVSDSMLKEQRSVISNIASAAHPTVREGVLRRMDPKRHVAGNCK